MLKKRDVQFDFYQSGNANSLEGENIEFRIYLKNVDGMKKYEVEFSAPLEGNIELDKVIDLNARVDKIVMKNKQTQATIKELIIDEFASFAIIANDLLLIKQTLCFTAKEII